MQDEDRPLPNLPKLETNILDMLYNNKVYFEIEFFDEKAEKPLVLSLQVRGVVRATEMLDKLKTELTKKVSQ